ncbi:RTA1-domain-containing protein [Exidia glandulosa HHB12029]|uniref:RTA1-domain-containing protein n=1 Tax=Exidia glandulosa HHB12029 TaxID=1314781 RepID=A0A166AS93_EXIGL|nr:RTA1-domain-containing protein [Exidia glandulosa HHB12029]
MSSKLLGLASLAAVVLSFSVLASADDTHPPRPADPFADPAHDPYNPLRYIPSNVLTGVAHAVFALVSLHQLYSTWKYKTWWFLILPISISIYNTGFAMRFSLHDNPEFLAGFIVQSILLVLAPCAFIAADYMLLGRLARSLEMEKHMIIAPTRITKIFVWSDIITFNIQGGGSGFTTSGSTNVLLLNLGRYIFLAGLILQAISFVFFTIMYVIWFRRVRRLEPLVWRRDEGQKWYNDWRALAWALMVSCIGILIRSIYRVAEASQGTFGTLATTEWIFYVFDTLPLFVAVAVFVPFWPGRFIPPRHLGDPKDHHELMPVTSRSAPA